MRNNKGFTLMELLAAIFIGGMVTAAMILIWKVASIQTGQGQRQTIIRNQISNFERQLYKDFQEADVITFPNSNNMIGPSNGLILAGLKHVMPYESGSFRVLPGNTAEFFAYCIKVEEGSPNVIKKSTGTITYDTTPNASNTYSLADYSTSATFTTFSNNCITNGKPILSDFTLTSVNLYSNGIYTFEGHYQKVFTNGRETTPIKIEVKNKFYNHGGFYYAN